MHRSDGCGLNDGETTGYNEVSLSKRKITLQNRTKMTCLALFLQNPGILKFNVERAPDMSALMSKVTLYGAVMNVPKVKSS